MDAHCINEQTHINTTGRHTETVLEGDAATHIQTKTQTKVSSYLLLEQQQTKFSLEVHF